MNRLRPLRFRLVLLPALALGLAAAGAVLLLRGAGDWLSPALAGGAACILAAALGLLEVLTKPRWLSRASLAAEILVGALAGTALAAGLCWLAWRFGRPLIDRTVFGPWLAGIDPWRSLACLGAGVLGYQVAVAAGRTVGARLLWRLFWGHQRHGRYRPRLLLRVSLTPASSVDPHRKGPQRRLRAFLRDLSREAVRLGGELYRYDQDGAVYLWRVQSGKPNSQALLCASRLRRTLAAKDAWYRRRFGRAPEFRACLHGGSLALQEVGWPARQIILAGPAAGILEQLDQAAARLDMPLLVSQDAMDALVLPAGYRIHRTINARLRDDREAWRIYAVEEIEQ